MGASRLDGKCAIVTGAGRGIGRAVAERLAADGAAIVAAHRSVDEGEELVGRLRAAGSEAEYVPADVRDEAAVERVIETAMRRFGRIDVLCNNAGVGLLRDVVNTSRDEYDEVFDTNVRSIFLCSRHAIRHML